MDGARAILRRVAHDRSVRQAFFAWALTRVVVFAILILAARFSPGETQYGGAVRNANISLREAGIAQELRTMVLVADALWLTGVARDGYEKTPFDARTPRNWAFFPLYPLLLRAAAAFTGDFALTGVVLSSVLFFLALVVLHKTVGAFGGDAGAADRAAFYAAAFPASYFFSLPYTESLFLLLTVGSFYAGVRGWWWTAGTIGALASATRVTGVLLLPALLVLYLQTYKRAGGVRLNILSLLLIPAGLFAFMIYLRAVTGNALAFADIQAAWGRRFGFFLRPLWRYLTSPLDLSINWDFRALNFAAALLALACGVWLVRRREWSLSTYTLLLALVPLSTLTLHSMARYTMVIFPVYFVLAHAGRRPLIDQTIRALFLAALAVLTLLFAAHFTLALS